MVSGVLHSLRLFRAARVLARYDALLTPEQLAELPLPPRHLLKFLKIGSRAPQGDQTSRLAAALSVLGPSYIKLGQFLATRPDIVGAKRAFELRALQDKLPPFGMEEAKAIIRANFGVEVETLFSEFGPPIAAASVAQVHRARTPDGHDVAVKILRPGVEKRFAADIESFYFAARQMEKWSAEGRRLRPIAAVATLELSMDLELDLRMEAAALAEMAANTADDPQFRLPRVDWQRTARQVLTTAWIEGTPISDLDTLKAKGFDLVRLGDAVIQSFLRHAIRDGFFHADMHQGNLFVDETGTLVAVDFGIMGRLGEKERRFLAEILYGFITRDYRRVSLVHFEAGYVPAVQDPELFAQALRAIGEPIMDLPAEQISMARLLTQLFEVTSQFDMKMQPQLLMLQKTMVVVEGVARTLNPRLNMWITAEPVVRGWIERKLGPLGVLENAGGSLSAAGRLALQLPELLENAAKGLRLLSGMAENGGVVLAPETLAALARQKARSRRVERAALVVGAAALAVIALKLLF